MIFIGSFVFALAMERWKLHKRIALAILISSFKPLPTLFGRRRGGHSVNVEITDSFDGFHEEQQQLYNDHQSGEPSPSARSMLVDVDLGLRRLPIILIGFMSAGFLMSMWLSNTATALIMIPNAMGIIKILESLIASRLRRSALENQQLLGHVQQDVVASAASPLDESESVGELESAKLTANTDQWDSKAIDIVRPFSSALLLSIAYAANTGGIATTIGTPTNLIFLRQWQIMFPERPVPNFMEWFIFAGPLAASIALSIALFLILFFVRRAQKSIKKSLLSGEESIYSTQQQQQQQQLDLTDIHQEYVDMGRPLYEEVMVALIFLVVILLWCTRTGIGSIPGWAALFPSQEYIGDGSVALLGAFILFFLPSKNSPGPGSGDSSSSGSNSKEYSTIMDWEYMRNFPWEIIVLFGGGFALAQGFVDSGLTKIIANFLQGLQMFPTFIVIVGICLVVTSVTEVVSNVATVQIFLPILAILATATDTDPLLYMLAGTVSSSLAFMLPIGTAPNMISFGYGMGRITIPQMALNIGFWINLMAIAITSSYCYFVIPLVFGQQ